MISRVRERIGIFWLWMGFRFHPRACCDEPDRWHTLGVVDHCRSVVHWVGGGSLFPVGDDISVWSGVVQATGAGRRIHWHSGLQWGAYGFGARYRAARSVLAWVGILERSFHAVGSDNVHHIVLHRTCV